MSVIPGADTLGFGFNILGQYNTSSVTSQLFVHHTTAAREFTYPPSNITYDVPDNTSVIESTDTTGQVQVFNSQKSVQDYFSVRAGVAGTYAAFSGAFSAAYSQTFTTEQSYYYCLAESEITGWKLVLSDQSTQWLSPSFTGDPLVEGLPSAYTTDNQDQFFALFRKYGTHYVASVTLGGNLNYFVAVDTAYSSSNRQIEANLRLEYKAVFYSAQADAVTEWQQLGEQWAHSRIVKVNAEGGDESILNRLAPDYEDSASGAFESWSDAVMANPAVVDFQLRPLSLLFSGAQAKAVAQALTAYMNGAIVVNALADYTPGRAPGHGNITTSSNITLGGRVLVVNPPVKKPNPVVSGGYVDPVSGYQVALFDGETLAVIMNHLYYIDNTDATTQSQVYTTMMQDINAVLSSSYLCAVAGFGVAAANFPAAEFAEWLNSCGATLSAWKTYIGYSGSPNYCSYACVGRQGLPPGRAIESFTGGADSVHGNIDASATVLLYADNSLANLVASYGSRADFGLIHVA